MSLSVEDIIAILKMLDASRCEEFRLEMEGVKLIVSKSIYEAAPALPTHPAVAAPPASPWPPRPAPTPSERLQQITPAAPSAMQTVPQGLHAVTAPMVGTFYRGPAPGAPPFAEVGSVVTETDVVCILEVMKLMNSISAGVRGRVVQVRAENGMLVEYGQVLMLIAPDAAPLARTGAEPGLGDGRVPGGDGS